MASQSNTAPPGYQWVDGAFYGGDGGYQLPGSYQPIPGYVAPTPTPGNFVGGPTAAATINAQWQPTASTTRQLSELLTNPVSGYSPNANYGAQLGRFQFSGTAPVPRTAPVGWGRYPGVDGSPGSAPWLAGQTMPPPQWLHLGDGDRVSGPPTNGGGTPTPPPNLSWARNSEQPWMVPQTPLRPPVTRTNWGSRDASGNVSNSNNGGNNNTYVPPVVPWDGKLPSQTVTGTTTAQQASGQTGYTTVTGPDGRQQWVLTSNPVDNKWAGYYVPPQYVGRPLPYGAFTSLFPNSQGTGWVKTPPPGWGPTWRPTPLGG